ncbi:MAG: hypothetical protein KC422_22820 [Trueperaceae bacterium]|nr:hypothetical protein [Trueperaceae bacterium]
MEALLEFQDYLLAYRLRSLVGGRLSPAGRPLSLSEYAQKRLERQKLAKELLAQADYRDHMKRVDKLTEELNFGFWHNPGETMRLLSAVIEQGGCEALESRKQFLQNLLSERELNRLSGEEKELLSAYYLGLIQASAAYLDAEVFTRLRSELDPLRDKLPLFIEALGSDKVA